MQATTSRVWAFAATVLGFAGLSVSLAGGLVAVAGLAVAGAALLGLLAIAWLALESPAAQDTLAPSPGDGPASNPDFEYAEPDMFPEEEDEAGDERIERLEAPAPPQASEPVIDLDSPLQRALAGLPPKPSAPARYSPRMPVIPADEEEAEPVRRARRLVPSGQTLGEKREATKKAKAKPAPSEMEFTVVPTTPRTPVRPAVVPSTQVPLVVARVAGKGAPPADLARGRCSGCDTLLWAPKARPINLRCPNCDKITLLK
jgi:hypothetical protein